MKTIIVAVRDVKAEVYAQPFCVVNSATAIRSFSDQVNNQDPKNMWNQHPQDFSLYQIGTYEDNTGLIEPITPPKLLIEATACLNLTEA